MQTQSLNPSPKAAFRATATNVSEHRAMVEKPAFDRAINVALLEYQAQINMTTSQNPNNAGFAGLKLCGAAEFVQVLKLLSEAPSVVQRAPMDNLDHKA